jgi:tetratricopeptide (TPR) repeat protein
MGQDDGPDRRQSPADAAARDLRRFAAAREAGDFHAALRAASVACYAAPHLAQPHYAYGEAWAALNEPARAEQAFAAALQIAPRWADAWVNYGLARYRQGAVGRKALTA